MSKLTSLEASRSVVVDTEVTSIGLKASLLYRYRHNNLSLSSQLSLKKHLCEVNFKDLEKFRSGLKFVQTIKLVEHT